MKKTKQLILSCNTKNEGKSNLECCEPINLDLLQGRSRYKASNLEQKTQNYVYCIYLNKRFNIITRLSFEAPEFLSST